MRTQPKEKYCNVRIENNLFNSLELASKQSNVKKSVFVRYAIEKALEQTISI